MYAANLTIVHLIIKYHEKAYFEFIFHTVFAFRWSMDINGKCKFEEATQAGKNRGSENRTTK